MATAAVSKPGFSVTIGVSTMQAAVAASEGEGADAVAAVALMQETFHAKVSQQQRLQPE